MPDQDEVAVGCTDFDYLLEVGCQPWESRAPHGATAGGAVPAGIKSHRPHVRAQLTVQTRYNVIPQPAGQRPTMREHDRRRRIR
ncbi:hypothetical protein GOEFS_035_00420 [Gordonia effusa NBRC 100432]|uniref:Uncharacterized protein n=1 Tax=Gordonia effusa NBRC 100432 TaxID=1077974 RepID=H0QXF9_9ACTN|nr:hypothetical protein GOEFS_035_00420 [Gordonia effusa NBRC 100432]